MLGAISRLKGPTNNHKEYQKMLKIREDYVIHHDDGRSHRVEGVPWYEPWTEDKGRLFKALQREYGRCISKVYCDLNNEAVGWVFEKREKYSDDSQTYKLETWVEYRKFEEREGVR